MSRAAVTGLGLSADTEDSVELVYEDMQNHCQMISDLYLTRSMSAHGSSSPQHKIAVFSRNLLAATSFEAVQDLEDYAICDLDECLSTSRIFPQDDCLHTEFPPFQSLVHGPSRLGRAHYNFQQGLLNTKEVLEIKASRL